jgi:NTP pyrophosphatase (non-canonical NTP hydrolase)
MELNEYQDQAAATDEKKRVQISAYGLVSEVGSVLGTLKKRVRHGGIYPSFRDDLREELGDTLWYLCNVATRNGISLQEIADTNLAKARSYFDPGKLQIFDHDYPPDEQFPRRFEVSFTEKKLNQSVLVKIMINGVIIGDSLTDNAYDPDGYLYHDAFHLAYVAVLGWSPVIRALLKRKRKSNPVTDEVEDGARAAIVEEAISLFVFNHAKRRDFFTSDDSIDFTLLKIVQDMAGHLEVKECTGKQWKRAIFLGYQMFAKFKENKGGTLTLNLDEQSIEYSPEVVTES